MQVNRTKPSKPQHDIIVSRQQVNLFLAGQGAGKTHVAGIVSGLLISSFPKRHGFIGANTYTQLSDSTLFRIRKVWKELFGWSEYSKQNKSGNYVVDIQPPAHFNTEDHEYDSYHGKICFLQGTVIYKGSLDNYKAHDGKEFSWAILDETKDTREVAVKEVILGRLREAGMYVDSLGNLVDVATDEVTGLSNEAFNPLYIFTSPAKVQWINEWFSLDEFVQEITESIYSAETYFKKDIGNKRITISSTYHNNHNLPANYISNQLANLHSGLQDMLIYGNPFSSSGGEFYKCFNRTRNVRDLRKIPGFDNGDRPYNPNIPLHITFDFNVNPYMTCTVWQVIGKKVYQIDEICLANPSNTTLDVCKEFIRRYRGHEAGLFVYGDPGGRQEDTRAEKGNNDYTVIMKTLVVFKPTQRVALAAPPVKTRGDFINTIFEKEYDGIEVLIHEKCAKSIDDYVYLKEASDGTKLKEKVKNPDTGVTYEKHGHTSDSGDYFICQAFANEFAKYKRGGSAEKPVTAGKLLPSKNAY